MLWFSVLAAVAATLASAEGPPVRYDTISCRNVSGAPFQQCQVTLVDRGGDKIAAYVTGPDGRQRILHFRRGVPSSTDAGSRLLFERNRDTLVIRVGRAEVYEMPDRLVAGK